MGNFIVFRERLQHKVAAHPKLTVAWAAQTAIIRKGDKDEGRLLINMTRQPCRIDILQGGAEYRKQEWFQLEERLRKLSGEQ